MVAIVDRLFPSMSSWVQVAHSEDISYIKQLPGISMEQAGIGLESIEAVASMD